MLDYWLFCASVGIFSYDLGLMLKNLSMTSSKKFLVLDVGPNN